MRGAASARKPAVNIGTRQNGRDHGANVIDGPADADAIVAAVERAQTPAFRAMLATITNPYGDGQAAQRIVDVVTAVPLDEALLTKRSPLA